MPCHDRCPWCGYPLELVWVHGHGQCRRCATNLEECCRGEVATPATGPTSALAPAPADRRVDP